MIKKKKISMLIQIAILFVIGVIVFEVLLTSALKAFAFADVMSTHRDRAEAAAEDLEGFLDRFPAHDWLLHYWYEHYDDLEIEYDAPYSADTVTARQYRLLTERNPGFSPEYADEGDVEALAEEDQKLYAEVVYSWLISRIDQMKQAHELSYVFGVVTEEPYDRQLLLFISAEPGRERGEGAGQVYPIGTELPVTEERREAVRNAVAGKPWLSYNEDEKYIDYYYAIDSCESHQMLIGITIYASDIDDTIHDQMRILGTLTVVFLVLLAVDCLLMVQFVILRPLKKVQRNIRLYKETKDSRTVVDNLSKLRSHNEIMELSGDAAALMEEMDAYLIRNERITAEKQRVQTELSLASRIQAAMLPSVFPPFPDRKDFEIYASMTPAKEVGGDFYDFFLVDDNRLCILIADVSGKGIPAALFMMASKITLSHLINSGSSPALVLEEANASICSKNPEEMFVTVWLGVLDLTSGKMICANAGHEYPMLRKPGERYEIVKDKHGFVLGGMDGVKYSEYELEMEPGSSLFLYTDGLAEAVDPDNEMFGTERILESLNAEPNRSPEELLRGMKEAVDGFVCGLEPFDDLTMIGFTYHGPPRDVSCAHEGQDPGPEGI